MIGYTERDLRLAAQRLGIIIEHRFGQEVVTLNEARRLLEQLFCPQLAYRLVFR